MARSITKLIVATVAVLAASPVYASVDYGSPTPVSSFNLNNFLASTMQQNPLAALAQGNGFNPAAMAQANLGNALMQSLVSGKLDSQLLGQLGGAVLQQVVQKVAGDSPIGGFLSGAVGGLTSGLTGNLGGIGGTLASAGGSGMQNSIFSSSPSLGGGSLMNGLMGSGLEMAMGGMQGGSGSGASGSGSSNNIGGFASTSTSKNGTESVTFDDGTTLKLSAATSLNKDGLNYYMGSQDGACNYPKNSQFQMSNGTFDYNYMYAYNAARSGGEVCLGSKSV